MDLRELMGGPGSHAVWESAGLAQKDGVHMTVKGYRILGEKIAEEILEAYDNYKRSKQ
jgi:lysophospholipase L1-like esterase